MPIKGLTDTGTRRFNEIGVIRKGGPKGANRPGKDLSYFRVVFYEGEEEAARRFQEVYGDRPREINVWLPFDTVSEVWDAWNEAYTAGALVHRCNGEWVDYARDPQTGEVLVRFGRDLKTGLPVPCTGEPVYFYTNKKGEQVGVHCAPRGRLRVIIPELQRIAYLTVKTGSYNDVRNLSEQLNGFEDLTNYHLRSVPFRLCRQKKMVPTPGPNGKTVRRPKWLLALEVHPDWAAAKVRAFQVAVPAALPATTEAEPEGNGEPDGWDEDVHAGDEENGVIEASVVEESPPPEVSEGELEAFVRELRETLAEHPRNGDPAPAGTRRSVKVALERVVGEGNAPALLRAAYGCEWEELTLGMAAILANAAAGRNGKFAELARALIAQEGGWDADEN